MTHDHGKSDRRKVPAKFANNGDAMSSAERDGGKASNQGKQGKQNTSRTQQADKDVQSALDRVRKVAKSDKKMQFTNLMHHIFNIDRLRKSYFAMKKTAAAGIDGETWKSYGEDLEANLQDLSERLHRGGYRAKPVRRVFIAKADGKQRPLGVPVLEDKIVQRSSVEVMNAIYETDFLDSSYGYRPGKGQHNCLDALYMGLFGKVNWVLDADIRGFFDNLNHEWLIKFVEHRIGDKRVIRLIQKWLKAGVMLEGRLTETEDGVPQGGSISPLLANIYLHYVLDLWTQQRGRDKSRGNMVIVRWADDFVVGFEHKSQAEKFLTDLKERMLQFGLELHSEKTRILEFGRFAANNRKKRGLGKPETFNFLGLTHICGLTLKNRKFTVLRQTIKKKMRAKLNDVKLELRRRMHHPVPEQGKWLRSVVGGHFRYYGVPTNQRTMGGFRHHVAWLWFRTLKRRSQKSKLTWPRMKHHIDRWLPHVQILHPYPLRRLRV
jgi:group II intron reverse transcriptase/maturase